MTKLFTRIEWVLAMLAGIALLAMMLVTFVDVIGRYGFNHSIFGAAEMIEYLMVAVIFAGIAFITAGDQHIKVDIFEPMIRRRSPVLQRWLVLTFSLAVYGFIAFELTAHSYDSWLSGKRTPVLDMPQWLVPGAAALLTWIGVALFLAAILATRGHPGRVGHLDHLPGDEVRREHLEL